ncbi:MAG: hypothetical protein IPN42_10925 [Methylococcaceae bacterium]|nr:hypothetical protein [Methylococcaceae bacterium]
MPDFISQLIEHVQAELLHVVQLQEQNKVDVDFRKRLNSLTPREMDILPLTIAGIPNKEIAQQLGVSFRTVELHRTNILRKTGASNFLELAHQCEVCRVSFESQQENS